MKAASSPGGYRILNVFLIESNFKRQPVLSQSQGKSDLQLQVEVTTEGSIIAVKVSISFSILSPEGNKPDVEAKISMVGNFEKFGSPNLSEEIFSSVNAPAIIFPFIREHLSSLSLKAGIGQILLPPINFTKKQPSEPVEIVKERKTPKK